jgi:hypothetical protein
MASWFRFVDNAVNGAALGPVGGLNTQSEEATPLLKKGRMRFQPLLRCLDMAFHRHGHNCLVIAEMTVFSSMDGLTITFQVVGGASRCYYCHYRGHS